MPEVPNDVRPIDPAAPPEPADLAETAALVRERVIPLRTAPDPAARVAWRAAPGVVGALSRCSGSWCMLDVGGKRGWVQKADVWGVGPGESFR